jgi:predicted signal transduction protein with EAL and GGDEF domain
MDDFGTGYCSLSNLKAFPFDRIKIDRSFIRCVDTNAEAATIVRAVLSLGRGLRLPVLAEGVETDGELAFLRNELCTDAQGYLLGRPEPIQAYRGITRDVRPHEHHRATSRNGQTRFGGRRLEPRSAETWAAGRGNDRTASRAFVSPFS